MKKNLLSAFIILAAIILAAFAGKSQNLVPNGDFETHIACNGGINNIPPWINPSGGTPDYLNACYAGFGYGVPDNFFGNQFAHSGDAYCGIILYYDGGASGLYREYLEVPLTSTLTAGACYHFEMYINLTEVYSRYTTTDVGVYLSDTLIANVPGNDALVYPAQIVNAAGNYPDTIAWTLVSGNFTAQGTENYLLIGNFKDATNPDTVLYNNNIFWEEAYVFVDDISLTLCTGIEEQNQNSGITIYPNPVGDELKIQNAELKIKEIKIFDLMGREVLKTEVRGQKSEVRINTSGFKQGIYIIEINGMRKKFIKQ